MGADDSDTQRALARQRARNRCPPASAARRTVGRSHRTIVVGSVVAVVACGGAEPMSTRPQRSLAEAVTPEVANQLVNGQFNLQSPTPGAVPRIDLRQAEAIAKGWVVTFGQNVRGYLEQGRGAPIDLGHLSPCGRTLYAESAYEDPAPSELTDPRLIPIVRPYGPFWIVTLCSPAGSPEVALAVSAYSTDLVIGPDGKISAPGVFYQGGWFVWEGIPESAFKRFLVTPEDAALRVADSTGARVASVPRLITPAPPRAGIPLYARWQVAVDRSVGLRPAIAGARIARQSRQLYVGADAPSGRIRFLAADSIQPAGDSVRYPTNAGPNSRRGDQTVFGWYLAHRRDGMPARLIPASVDSVGGGTN